MTRRRGFTLSEVLLGLLLLTCVFFALASIFPTSLASLRKSQRNVAAMNLARQAIEDWKTRPFGTLILTTVPQTSTALVDGVTYVIVVTVSDVDPPDPKNLKIIDVQVLSQDATDTGQAQDRTCVFNYSNPL